MRIEIPHLKLYSYILILVIMLSAVFSFVLWASKVPGIRRTFIFESTDSKNCSIESRYLPVRPEYGKVRNYIDELLLGPVSEHCRPVFNPGTRVLSCFERRGVLYIDLSQELLLADKSFDFKRNIVLFRKNIMKNFTGIKKIDIYIDGKQIYPADR